MQRPVPRPITPAPAQQAPAPQAPAPAPAPSAPGSGIRAGWSSARQQADAVSGFTQVLKPTANYQIIKFLEDQPYASYARHWIESAGPRGTQRRPYTCLASIGLGRECPLCAVGHRATPTTSFNVAVMGDDGEPVLKSWDVGVKLLNAIEAWHNDPRVGPLTKDFYAVNKPQGGNVTGFPVPASVALENYGVAAPDPARLAALGLYTADDVQMPTVQELREIAAEITASE